MGQAKDEVTGVAAGALLLQQSAITTLTSAQFLVKIAEYLYKQITKREPLSKTDRDYYDAMCNEYTGTLHMEIPLVWKLDNEGCPLYSTELGSVSSRLLNDLKTFNKCNHLMKHEISAIVSNIASLFSELSLRWWSPLRKEYRKDGFELMFLSEMATWLIIDLPRYDIHAETTADIVLNRIEYCKKIQRSILGYKNDIKIANPKDTLDSIIKALDGIHQNLSQTHRSANFTHIIEQIEGGIVANIHSTFNMFYLMLDVNPKFEFQVAGFLDPTEGKKTEVEKLKTSLLGQWIEGTCNAAGIVSNGFKSKLKIPYTLIKSHITISPELTVKNIKEDMGFDEFVWAYNYDAPKLSRKATEPYLKNSIVPFLELIRELHRSIIRMSYVSQNLTLAKQLGIDYGQTWLFNGAGEPILDGLKAALFYMVEYHKVALNNFWAVYYTKIYAIFAKKEGKAAGDKTYDRLMKAFDFFEENIKQTTLLGGLIRKITLYKEQLKDRDQSNKEEQHNLTSGLMSFLADIPGYDPENLDALGQINRATAVQSTDQNRQPKPNSQGNPTMTTDTPTVTNEPAAVQKVLPNVLSKEHIKVAILLRNLFAVKIADYPSDVVYLSTIKNDVSFLQKSPLCALIYKEILESHQYVAESFSIVALFHGYALKLTALRQHYSRLIKALSYIASEPFFFDADRNAQLMDVYEQLRWATNQMCYAIGINPSEALQALLNPSKEHFRANNDGTGVVISHEIEIDRLQNEVTQTRAETAAAIEANNITNKIENAAAIAAAISAFKEEMRTQNPMSSSSASSVMSAKTATAPPVPERPTAANKQKFFAVPNPSKQSCAQQPSIPSKGTQ